MEPRISTSHHIPAKSDTISPGLFRIHDEDNLALNAHDNGAEAHYAMSNLRRVHTVAQDRNVTKRSPRSRSTKKRVTEALLRVRDSHDLVLRRRSLKRSNAHEVPCDALAAVREAKNFTVGNVGHNGRIYLRYVLWRCRGICTGERY